MSEFIFKVGDRVKCHFYGDKVFTLEKSISGHGSDYLIIDTGADFLSFYKDGRCMFNHTHSSLILVERAKTKVKVKRYVNIYRNAISFAHVTRAEADATADAKADHDRIACVELTGEYEV